MRNLLLAVVALTIPSATFGALQFSAYMETDQALVFQLTDTQSGAKSDWLAIGGTFQGHTLTAFDREREVLVVQQGTDSIRLPLKEARVKKGDADGAKTETVPREHIVARGETLFSIAKRYGVTTARLVELNPQLKDKKLIHVGDKVRVRE